MVTAIVALVAAKNVERAQLDAALARRFRSGRPCIDFAHTGGVGAWKAAELVNDAPGVGRWLAVVLDVETVTALSSDLG